MSTTVLVSGGAGYIGSHTVRQLIASGFSVTVVDNLYSGYRWLVPDGAEFVERDAGDLAFVSDLIADRGVRAIIHFAGHIVVPESVIDPLKYYQNNCAVSQNLIQASRATGVKHFIFSSSAAVYGVPESIPISESAANAPINPYGTTKLITEWVLRDVARSLAHQGAATPFTYVALRYFNVAGAALDGSIGQATPEATHLIKVACEAALGKRRNVQIFGTDYPTPDGTCIR
ncbi:MAG: UDP-glucose 4-epimerase GalE, partial [Gammaproteobacteria bacterium]|nr:UDP-glucose 4-epimerase GalE [Gammaproteobacteria bacterium]